MFLWTIWIILDKNVSDISTYNVDSDNYFEFRVSNVYIIYRQTSFWVGCDGLGCPIFAVSNSHKYHVVIQTEWITLWLLLSTYLPLSLICAEYASDNGHNLLTTVLLEIISHIQTTFWGSLTEWLLEGQAVLN